MLHLKTSTVKKALALILVVFLLATAFSGCQKPPVATNPSTPSTDAADPTSPATTAAAPTEPIPGIKGTVTADELNVREGVGISFDVVTKLKKGDTVEVYEQQDLNGIAWGRISQGWICLTYVHLEGQPLEEIPEETVYEITDPITGTVIATELNIRKGPSTNYDVAGELKKGDEITITELQGTWGKCEKGWVNTVFVYFKDTMDSKTVQGVVNADQLNVRSGPSTGYESLAKLSEGTEVTIIKQVTIRERIWGYTGEGWICMDYVDIK